LGTKNLTSGTIARLSATRFPLRTWIVLRPRPAVWQSFGDGSKSLYSTWRSNPAIGSNTKTSPWTGRAGQSSIFPTLGIGFALRNALPSASLDWISTWTVDRLHRAKVLRSSRLGGGGVTLASSVSACGPTRALCRQKRENSPTDTLPSGVEFESSGHVSSIQVVKPEFRVALHFQPNWLFTGQSIWPLVHRSLACRPAAPKTKI